MPESWALEVFKALLNLGLLIFTWTLGKQLLSYWEDRQRLKEVSLELRRGFHIAYGEFKSLVRTWKLLDKPVTGEEGWSALVRDAVEAEGRLEALLSDVSSLKSLTPHEVTILGLFRQGYQTVRQAVTKGEQSEVPQDFKQTQYKLFNDLMTAVSRLAISQRRQPSDEEARKTFAQVIDVRSSEWRKAVELRRQDEAWNSLLGQVTQMRLRRSS